MPFTADKENPVSIRATAFVTAVLLLPSLAFVTNQSLWADEACSAWFAEHAQTLNPAQFPGMLGAVSQMPGYHLLLLAWVHIAGDSERALRGLNIPFAAMFLAALLMLCQNRAGRLWWAPAAPFAFFPLLTYYTNEARPYTALLALSAAATAALVTHLRYSSRSSAWLCAAFSLAAFSLHLLGCLTSVTLVLFLLLRHSSMRELRAFGLPALVTLPGYLVLLAYYARVRGAGTGHAAAAVLQQEIPGNITATWRNCLFVLYEALGFSGLGPPRNALRIHPGVHSFHGYAATMFVGATAAVPLMLLMRRTELSAKRLLSAAALGLGLLFLLARISHFGFFGRHAMALVGCFACAIVMMLSERSRLASLAAIMLTAAWTLSSSRLLVLYPYTKDDPRAALRMAIAASSSEDLPILWNAGREEAVYYDAFDPARKQDMLFTAAPTLPTAHARRVTPIVVLPPLPVRVPAGAYILVQGKVDTFDPTGYWTALLKQSNTLLLARYNGFDVYRIRFSADGAR